MSETGNHGNSTHNGTLELRAPPRLCDIRLFAIQSPRTAAGGGRRGQRKSMTQFVVLSTLLTILERAA